MSIQVGDEVRWVEVARLLQLDGSYRDHSVPHSGRVLSVGATSAAVLEESHGCRGTVQQTVFVPTKQLIGVTEPHIVTSVDAHHTGA